MKKLDKMFLWAITFFAVLAIGTCSSCKPDTQVSHFRMEDGQEIFYDHYVITVVDQFGEQKYPVESVVTRDGVTTVTFSWYNDKVDGVFKLNISRTKAWFGDPEDEVNASQIKRL